MKKTLSVFLVILTLLSLIACGAKQAEAPVAAATEATAAPTEAPTPEPDPIDVLTSEQWKEVVKDTGLAFTFNRSGTGFVSIPVTNTQNGTSTTTLNTIDCTWSYADHVVTISYNFYGETTADMLFVYENGIYTIQAETKAVIYARASDYGTAYNLYHVADAAPEPTVQTVTKKSDHMEIVGMCVDDSYQDKNGAPLKLVYLFYKFIATDQNLKIDSKYTKLTVDGKNTYESDHYASTASAMMYMPNFYYSSYIKDVYLGSSLLVAATFYIPEGDLTAGKTVTISDSQIPGCEAIFFYTDDIQHFSSGEEIAKAFDPDGHKQILQLFEEADAQTTKQVKKLINGYYWWCYVNNTKYEVEFWADNNFEVRSSLGTKNQGTYSVRKGYIFCTYTGTGYTIRIPYTIENNDVKMDVAEAFDVLG